MSGLEESACSITEAFTTMKSNGRSIGFRKVAVEGETADIAIPVASTASATGQVKESRCREHREDAAEGVGIGGRCRTAEYEELNQMPS